MFLLLLLACGPGTVKIGEGFDTGDTDPILGTDLDGDGYAGVDRGGFDCDDADPTIHPDAVETWYDGIDQDCSGGSDFDQDGDGVEANPGTDCDDTQADVLPGATETRDLVDQDCDGLVDEDFVTAGAVIVSEVMEHPLAASDAEGEWFELTNTDGASIDVIGWTITSDDGDRITIGASLVIASGQAVVLGANADPGFNGGVTVDYAYDRTTMSLSADDSLFVNLGDSTVFDVEWTSTWALEDGTSIQLDPDHLALADARQSAYWCAATTSMGSGDHGTPGATNDDCTSIDEDGDGYSPDRGDCDDDDPTVSPGGTEAWNGVDDDCDGLLDRAPIDEVATGWVDGAQQSYLGVYSGLGIGDLVGDATPDLVVASAVAGTYTGRAWVMDGDDRASLAGDLGDYSEAELSGGTYGYLGAVSAAVTDVTGDGQDDLVVGGGGYSGERAAVAIFAGGALSGTLDTGDADVLITGSSSTGYGTNRVDASLDMNGDGLADLLYTDGGATGSSNTWYAGKVWFFDGDALSGELSTDDAERVISGSTSQGYLGIGLAGGDVDGDGYDDAMLGAPGGAGSWFEVDGGSNWGGDQTDDDAASRTYTGTNSTGGVGFGRAIVADLDGSGEADVAFGGFRADKVWIYLEAKDASSSVDTDDADIEIDGDGAAMFGFALSGGDYDGDGVTDLAVGAPAHSGTYPAYYWYQSPGNDTGELSFFDVSTLSDNASSDDAWAVATGEESGDLFGAVLSEGRDIDGNGIDDLLVAAPQGGDYTGGGRAYLLMGSR